MLSLMTVFLLAMPQANANDPIVTESTSESTVNSNSTSSSTSNSTVTTNGKSETTVKSPPPSAISPSINSSNSDLCTVGVSGAVQTQILGISSGATVRDMNCERLKNAKVLYDMGMKVAAVSVMCQDSRVFNAMMYAGTPCPFDGKIGAEAAELWAQNVDKWPKEEEMERRSDDTIKGVGWGILGSVLIGIATGGIGF